MKFFAVSLSVHWTALAAFLSATSWAAGQQTIQFSKPVDQDLGKANAFLHDSSRFSPGAFNAPMPLFGDRTPSVSFDRLPSGPVPVVIFNSPQAQKNFDARRNWALMTPEEILNIPTPEKILGIAAPNDDQKLSPDERFLQRRRQEETAAATNGMMSQADNYWRDDQNQQIQFSDANGPFGQANKSSSALINQKGGFFDNWNANAPKDSDRQAASVWSSSFGQPLPKATPEALAGMDRFRAMMDGTTAEAAPASTPYSYQPAATANPRQPFLPAAAPARHSAFGALDDDIGRPVGLTPLQGLTDSRPVAKKTSTPLVQPPPWLNNTPQPFNLPQRQF